MDPVGVQVLVAVILWVLVSLAIGLRFWAKKMRGTLGIEDPLLLVGLAMIIVLGIENILWAQYGFLGLHQDDLEPTQLTVFYKYLIANFFTYAVTPLPIKISILLSYNRLFGISKWFRKCFWFGIFLAVSWTISFIIASALFCIPLSKAWDPTVPGTCENTTAFSWANGVSNLCVDLYILALPAIPITQLQINSVQKQLLLGTFLTGLLSTTASIVRLVFIPQIGQGDATYKAVPATICTFIEPCMTSIAASIPFYKPLISQLRGQIRSSFNSSARVEDDSDTVLPSWQKSKQRKSMPDAADLLKWPLPASKDSKNCDSSESSPSSDKFEKSANRRSSLQTDFGYSS